MKFSSFPVVLILIALSVFTAAQSPTATLRGQVTDPSGAVVTDATVAVVANGTLARSAPTNRSGVYEIGNLAPGKYTVTASAKGFAVFVQTEVDVAAGQPAQLNIALEISVAKEKVNVQEETPQVDVNPADNAGAIVLSGKDLEALPDDPDELQQDLEALAGPSAGPNGGQIYIDGFTAGQLPPKASIREIRVNQNPFSAEYDKLGYGRIEIFTKPGTDKLHGQVSVVGNASGMNSRNPFLHVNPVTHVDPFQPYDSKIYMGSLGGSINKKISFSFDFQRRNINEVAAVNAIILDSNFQQVPFNASVPNPHTRTNFSPRIDYQITPDNSLTARYQFFHNAEQNDGVGQLVLPSAGYNSSSSEHTVQISDTQILGTRTVNETRFQYLRQNERQNPLSTDLAVIVPGSFTGGGSSGGAQTNHTDHYELQNYTSLSRGKHFLKFGGRFRVAHDVSLSGSGFNGTYNFRDLATYSNALQGLPNGTPNQFSISAASTASVPTVDATVLDAGLYVQDDFRLRTNLTLSYGLRFETQNAIHDHQDLAPRVGFAWGIGGGGKNTAKTVLRAGYGLFYDRFGEDLVLDTHRYNGITERQYVVSNPLTFPQIPVLDTLTPQTQTVHQISSNLHAPYVMQAAVSLERQVTKVANVSLSYLNSRGVHQLVSLNINAPTPGTPGSSGPTPFPAQGPIYQYSSAGVFRQNQLIATFNIRAGAKLSLFGNYSLNYANSDASGASSFPTDQYDLAADYSRASFDTRHRLFVGGSIGLPYNIRLSPFTIVNSGAPYNVTVGQDLNGDSVINDRPAFSNLTGACLSLTAACHYTVRTGAYVPVPINYLTGPAHVTLNLRLAKTFGFGPEKSGKVQDAGPSGPPTGLAGLGRGPGGGGGGGRGGFGPPGGPFGGVAGNRRYNLTLSINARNVLNHANAANPIGNLGGCLETQGGCASTVAPNFGHSIALAGGPFSSAAANRKIELQAMFSF